MARTVHSSADGPGSSALEPQPSVLRAADYLSLFSSAPTAFLVLTPDLVIAEANDACLCLMGRARSELVGRDLFDAFAPASAGPTGDGHHPLLLSFQRTRDTRLPDQIPLLRYNVPDPATGQPQQRYWSILHTAIPDPSGQTRLVLQRIEDVTEFVLDHAGQAGRDTGTPGGRRVEADLYARAGELRAALAAEATANRRLAGMADAALQLAAARSVDQLIDVVATAGLAALGAQAGTVAVFTGDGALRLAVTDNLEAGTPPRFSDLPAHADAPAAWVARNGRALVLPDRASGHAWSRAMAAVYESTGRHAWVIVPLRVGERPLGSLSVGWAEERSFGTAHLDLIMAFAGQCALSLDRLLVLAAERLVAAESRELSEALQRSLLTEPTDLGALEIAVRYLPAASGAEIGGDWYDAFQVPGGDTTVVVGDVTGHDRAAAAAMGQLRNLLRGVAQTIFGPPGVVLAALDRTIAQLHVDTLATAVLAQVSVRDGRFAWSNAGHLPPLLIDRAGTATLLTSDADLLLGLDPQTPRSEHEIVLAPGATMVLYTDGLVERRGESLDVGLERLTDAAAGAHRLSPTSICDQLVERLAGAQQDDIALLVLRLRPISSVLKAGTVAVASTFAVASTVAGGPSRPAVAQPQPQLQPQADSAGAGPRPTAHASSSAGSARSGRAPSTSGSQRATIAAGHSDAG